MGGAYISYHAMKERDINPFRFYYLGAAGIFAVIFWGLSQFSTCESWMIYLCSINVASFSLFGFDKGAAKSGSLRVPEVVIFCLAALGGTPAILLSMHVFRHKIRKAKFQIVLVFILIIQILLVDIYFI